MWFVLAPFQRWRGATRDAGEASGHEKRGELPSPRRSRFASGRVVEFLEVHGRRVAERRVQASGVVEAFDEAEDFAPRLARRRKAPAVEEFALERQRSPKASDVYCEPWSL